MCTCCEEFMFAYLDMKVKRKAMACKLNMEIAINLFVEKLEKDFG